MDPHALRTLQPRHRHLDAFVGRWQVSGRNADSAPSAPNSPISGENVFERVPGGFYLLSRFNHQNDSGAHAGVGVMGLDESDAFFVHNFDNLGYERRYSLELIDGVWHFKGRFERARLVFGQDGQSFEERWELSKDGERFELLCEMRSVKLGAHA